MFYLLIQLKTNTKYQTYLLFTYIILCILQMYKNLFKKLTPLGVSIDKCIQPACEYVRDEKIIGLVAGDEHSFEVS